MLSQDRKNASKKITFPPELQILLIFSLISVHFTILIAICLVNYLHLRKIKGNILGQGQELKSSQNYDCSPSITFI